MSSERTAARTPPIVTDEQIRAFREDGFLAIPRLVDDDTVARLRDAYDEFLVSDVGGQDNRKLGGVVRQIMYPHSHHPYFADNPARDAAYQVACALMGEDDPVFFYDMLLSKAPGETKPTLWHQDHAYAQIPFTPAGTMPPNEWVQFWVALDDVDEETGCMTFIPGSHQAPLREHYVFSGEPQGENRMLATDDYDESRAVRCPLRAGGCTVHLDGTLHYTDGNRTKDRPRRAYIFSFRPKEVAWLEE